jgi:hypothetical protein
MNSKVQLAVGLDAGSARTRCVIGVIENGGIRIWRMAWRLQQAG